MTKEQAIALYDSNWWEGKPAKEVALWQLTESKLCMPFSKFHESVEAALGRPVFTHEFAFPNSLIEELKGMRGAPSMDDIINLIPQEKLVIAVV